MFTLKESGTVPMQVFHFNISVHTARHVLSS